jgi:hypothetical protein
VTAEGFSSVDFAETIYMECRHSFVMTFHREVASVSLLSSQRISVYHRFRVLADGRLLMQWRARRTASAIIEFRAADFVIRNRMIPRQITHPVI